MFHEKSKHKFIVKCKGFKYLWTVENATIFSVHHTKTNIFSKSRTVHLRVYTTWFKFFQMKLKTWRFNGNGYCFLSSHLILPTPSSIYESMNSRFRILKWNVRLDIHIRCKITLGTVRSQIFRAFLVRNMCNIKSFFCISHRGY